MAYVTTFLFFVTLNVATAFETCNRGPCYRDCSVYKEPRVCHFEFYEEMYPALNSGACGNCSKGVAADCNKKGCVPCDGVERIVFTYNRVIPGPSIDVCKGDTIVVILHNRIPGQHDTIHWHGIRQKGTPFMDGMATITQCPVTEGQSFQYKFLAEEGGTYFYHSHSGLHKMGGTQGPLIIRVPDSENLHRGLYDFDLCEHTMYLQDWMHVTTDFVFPGLSTRIVGQPASSLLINGRGTTTRNSPNNEPTKIPLAEFVVKSGYSYRFRVISGGALNCPFRVRILQHSLILISSDGQDIKPKIVESIELFSGERYDFVLNADQPPSVYWIYVRTTGFCDRVEGSVEQWAILRYQDAGVGAPPEPKPSYANQPPIGRVVGSPSIPCNNGQGNLCPAEFRAAKTTKPNDFFTRQADLTVVIPLTFKPLNVTDYYKHFLDVGAVVISAMLGGISHVAPSSPLLTQPGESPVCDSAHRPADCDGKDVCECTHVIKLPLNHIVDIITVDALDTTPNASQNNFLAHAMHLHGYSFYCMTWQFLKNITDGDARVEHVNYQARRNMLPIESSSPPKKDVLVLPGAGVSRVRIETDNPGMWFFHCHFMYHMAAGMELVFQVGEVSDFPPIPPDFPKCKSYVPDNY